VLLARNLWETTGAPIIFVDAFALRRFGGAQCFCDPALCAT
jgi:hypothetical protein